MFDIKNVDICVSTRYLIKNLNLTLNRGDKCAIIGEEGNGKSTLLKAILGLADYAILSGTVSFNGNRVGYLSQNLRGNLSGTVKDYLFLGDDEYYSNIGKLYELFDDFELDEAILKQDINTLSGGELVKVSLMYILLDNPDILFLDEPTNDLDIKALEWLEGFINSTDKPILYVSHDETLLENTANMILHIEQVKKKQECIHTVVRTTYSEYVEMRIRKLDNTLRIAKNERREMKKREEKLNRIMNSVHDKQNSISRSDPHGAKVLKTKMKSLKAQEKKISNTSLTEMPDPEEGIYFSFDDLNVPKSKVILNLQLDELKSPNKVLAKNIELEVKGSEHVCIVGDNGTGKTTLMRVIYDVLRKRNDISVGVMPQDYMEILKSYKTPLDFVASTDEDDITDARKYLGNMKFTRDEMIGDIKNLSNGSLAKLFLVKLVREKYDVLLLDEPTRNTSPLSNPIIRGELKRFNGTIISVSHDRKYINEVATYLYELKDGFLKKIK